MTWSSLTSLYVSLKKSTSPRFLAIGTPASLPLLSAFFINCIPGIFMRLSFRRHAPQIGLELSGHLVIPARGHPSNNRYETARAPDQRVRPADRSGTGAPARAQPVQLASLVVVTQSSSFIDLPQYVSFIPGLATCTLPSPLAWRIFTCG